MVGRLVGTAPRGQEPALPRPRGSSKRYFTLPVVAVAQLGSGADLAPPGDH